MSAPPAGPLPVVGAAIFGVGVEPPAVGVTDPPPVVAVVVPPALGVPAAPAMGVTEPPPVVGVVVPVAAPAPLIVTVQVTSAPPPFPEPLHCLIVGNEAVVLAGVTLHLTRSVPPPPFPELSHCWIVAEVSFGVELGMHTVVGCVPPPCPEPMHWLTVTAPVPAGAPVTITSHFTIAPPPLPDPLHWSIAVTDCVETVGPMQVSAVPAPVQEVTVTVAVVAPVMATATVQCTVLPPWLSTPSHCVTVESAARADGVDVTASAITPIAKTHMIARRQPSEIAGERGARVDWGVLKWLSSVFALLECVITPRRPYRRSTAAPAP
jgi:hypothetical protein